MNEADLVKKYQKTGDRIALAELLRQLEPTIKSYIAVSFGRSTVPPTAIEAEAMRLAVDAISKYSPDKGASLKTWVTYSLQKVQRFVETYRSVARIPSDLSTPAHKFHSAMGELKMIYGRDPTMLEISEHTGIPLKVTDRLSREVGTDLPTSSFEGWEPITRAPESTIIDYVYLFDMTPDEKFVFENVAGYNPATKRFEDAKRKKGGQVAKMMKKSPATVSQIKNSVVEKINKRLQDRASTARVSGSFGDFES